MRKIAFLFAISLLNPTVIKATTTTKIPKDVLMLHKVMGQKECVSEMDPIIHELGKSRRFYLILCHMGAYNFSYHGYIKTPTSVDIVQVMTWNEELKQAIPTKELLNPDFDVKTKVFQTYNKFRRLGDCGQWTVSELVETQNELKFVPTEIRFNPKCNGTYEAWPVVFP